MKKVYVLLLAAIAMVSCSVERHPEYMMDDDTMTKNIDESFPFATEWMLWIPENVVGPYVSLWRICWR